jgi:hypothetical protein
LGFCVVTLGFSANPRAWRKVTFHTGGSPASPIDNRDHWHACVSFDPADYVSLNFQRHNTTTFRSEGATRGRNVSSFKRIQEWSNAGFFWRRRVPFTEIGQAANSVGHHVYAQASGDINHRFRRTESFRIT